MSITLTSIYLHHWKSFMKFGAKKSHEMISYNISSIASSGEWELGMSTKPCNLDPTVLIQFMNKSYERFMLSKHQENASMDQKT